MSEITDINEKVVVLDNGGKTYDRYTIIQKPCGTLYGANEDPFHPMGFGQYCGEVSGDVDDYIEDAIEKPEWLGEVVKYEDLPEGTQNYITQILSDD